MPPRKELPQFSDDKPLIITKTNIALTWPVVVAMCSLLLYCAGQLWDIRQTLKDQNAVSWKQSQMREYALMSHALNPSLVFPNVDEIARRIDK